MRGWGLWRTGTVSRRRGVRRWGGMGWRAGWGGWGGVWRGGRGFGGGGWVGGRVWWGFWEGVGGGWGVLREWEGLWWWWWWRSWCRGPGEWGFWRRRRGRLRGSCGRGYGGCGRVRCRGR